MELQIIKSTDLKPKPTGKLTFGKVVTDHMFVMEYKDSCWKNARIQPYQPFIMDPMSAVFHYGQAVFEGLKAFRDQNGRVRIFRPDQNIKRLNSSSQRLCIPPLDEDFVLKALKTLIDIERDWIPTDEGTSLYIRPSIIACDASLGVHASKSYIFFIILCPVGAYYENGLAPVKLFVEDSYVRACKGGTGHYKVAGNYASSLLASENAHKLGCDQVMWLDAKENRFVEEVGSMNIFFVFGDKVVTPSLNGSILPGITRKSVIELLSAHSITVEQRIISIDEILSGVKSGELSEIFGTGTAAVISPVGSFIYKDKTYIVNGGQMGKISASVYDELTGIQCGRLDDKFGWVYNLD